MPADRTTAGTLQPPGAGRSGARTPCCVRPAAALKAHGGFAAGDQAHRRRRRHRPGGCRPRRTPAPSGTPSSASVPGDVVGHQEGGSRAGRRTPWPRGGRPCCSATTALLLARIGSSGRTVSGIWPPGRPRGDGEPRPAPSTSVRSVPAPAGRRRTRTSATVGPEPMMSSQSPTTSDKARVRAGLRPSRRASCPPLTRRRVLPDAVDLADVRAAPQQQFGHRLVGGDGEGCPASEQNGRPARHQHHRRGGRREWSSQRARLRPPRRCGRPEQGGTPRPPGSRERLPRVRARVTR